MPAKIPIDINILIEEYLKEGASFRSVARTLKYKYNINISYKTVYTNLISCEDQRVLDKIKEQKEKNTNLLGKRQIKKNAIKNYIETKTFNKNLMFLLNREKTVICVLECLHCGEVHVIKEKFYSHKNCKCGKNIIYFCTPNFLNCKVIYKSKRMKELMLKSYDPYKS